MESFKKIAVIGSNSFSGSDYIDYLLELGGIEVAGFSRSPEKSAVFLPYKRHKKAPYTFHQRDLNLHTREIMDALDKFQPDAIVNFAAQSEVAPSWKHPEHWFETNTVALARLMNELKDRKYLKRYLHISSPEVYGNCQGRVLETAPLNPSTPYAASKAAADLFLSTLVKNFNFPLVTVRATNVYGAHQQLFKIIPRTVINLKMGRVIQLHGGGVAVKSYIHIRDVSRAEHLILGQGKTGELYHISPDQGVAVRDVVSTLCRMAGKDFVSATQTVEERLGQDAAYVIDSAKVRAMGWKTQISLEQGLQGVIDWVNGAWDEIKKENLEYVHKA